MAEAREKAFSISRTADVGGTPSLRAKRSNPRFRFRPPGDWATPRPLPSRVLEALATRPVLGTRRRTISWRDGLLRYTNKKQRAQRSGKPALSYPRKRVSSGTRCGG